MRANYYEQANIGAARYVVNYHNGTTTHTDGSPFYDVVVFSSKRKRDGFVRALCSLGYTAREA